jgi:hypothetical protein
MYRRRRQRSGEIVFQFDSFLDLVANVVGIILRLILVAWVGARAYTGVFRPPAMEETSEAVVAPPPPTEPALSTEPEKAALREATRRLVDARSALLEQLRRQEEVESRGQSVREERAGLEAAAGELLRTTAAIESERKQSEKERGEVELSLAEIRKRSEAVEKELEALKKQPVVRQVLRYQTPVARTVQSEEVHFEVRKGRVCFLDVDALLRDVKQNLRSQGELLKTRWELREETAPAGAFKMQYLLVRERTLIDNVTSPLAPDDRSDFRFGLERWEAVPLREDRGEPAEKALLEGSQFLRLVDHLDPSQTAVTFWVYPDSFPAYRALRDHCLRRELLVAGRPLPEGVPIASSRHGTASRGQ